MNSLEMHLNSRVIQIGEKSYKMDFDMQALSIAEQVYATRYGRNVNVAEIVEELFEVKMSACMAFAYGALSSAGEVVTWKEFSKEIFTYEHFDEVFKEVSAAIRELFNIGTGGEQPEGDAPEGDIKN